MHVEMKPELCIHLRYDVGYVEHIEQNSFLFHITRHIILLSNEEKNYSYIVRVGSCKSRAIQSMHMEYIKSPKDVLYSSDLDKGKNVLCTFNIYVR